MVFWLKVYEAKVYEAKVYETEGIQGLKVYKTTMFLFWKLNFIEKA